VNTGHELQEGALAASVRADDPEELTALDREADSLHSLELLDLYTPKRMEKAFLERISSLMRKFETLPHIACFDGELPHVSSARYGSSCLYVIQAIPSNNERTVNGTMYAAADPYTWATVMASVCGTMIARMS